MLPPAWKSRPGTTSLQKPERSGSLCRFEARTRRCIPCAVSTRRRSATLCTRVCACAASAYCSEPICSAGCLNYRPDAADFPVNANSASRDRHSTPKTNSKLADCSRDIAAGVSNPTNASARWPGGRQASRTIRASRVSPNNFRSRRQPSSEGRVSVFHEDPLSCLPAGGHLYQLASAALPAEQPVDHLLCRGPPGRRFSLGLLQPIQSLRAQAPRLGLHGHDRGDADPQSFANLLPREPLGHLVAPQPCEQWVRRW